MLNILRGVIPNSPPLSRHSGRQTARNLFLLCVSRKEADPAPALWVWDDTNHQIVSLL
jgi:hypothetical protein